MTKLEMSLLDILQEDCRISLEKLAVMTGSTLADVASAVQELENKKIILRYSPTINWDRTDRERVEAMIEVRVTPQRDMGFDAIARRIYRFDEVMEPLFQSKVIDGEKRDWLFDVFMHYLIELEFRSGLTKTDWNVHAVMDEMENDRYGREITKLYQELSDREKYYVAHMITKQERTGASVEKYAEVLSVLLENGIVYKNKYSEKTLLLYVGKRENTQDKNKIRLAEELFQPLGYDLVTFWEKHFAVLDEKQTMEIDQIELL